MCTLNAHLRLDGRLIFIFYFSEWQSCAHAFRISCILLVGTTTRTKLAASYTWWNSDSVCLGGVDRAFLRENMIICGFHRVRRYVLGILVLLPGTEYSPTFFFSSCFREAMVVSVSVILPKTYRYVPRLLAAHAECFIRCPCTGRRSYS